jgi:hypothetical protein
MTQIHAANLNCPSCHKNTHINLSENPNKSHCCVNIVGAHSTINVALLMMNLDGFCMGLTIKMG